MYISLFFLDIYPTTFAKEASFMKIRNLDHSAETQHHAGRRMTFELGVYYGCKKGAGLGLAWGWPAACNSELTYGRPGQARPKVM